MLDWFPAWLQNQPQTWQGPIISGLMTLVTAAVGLVVVGIQLRAQRRNLATQLDTQGSLLIKQLDKQQELLTKQLETQRELLGIQLEKQAEIALDGIRQSEVMKLKRIFMRKCGRQSITSEILWARFCSL